MGTTEEEGREEWTRRNKKKWNIVYVVPTITFTNSKL